MSRKDHKFDRFALTGLPFHGMPDEPFLDASRDECLKQLQTFLGYRGFAVITGPPGTGKTMLLNHLCRRLQPNENRVIYIPFATLSPSDMLRSICAGLGLEPVMSKSRMLLNIQERVAEIQPVNPVLVLDEVQKISHPTMEIVRLLANFNFEEKNLFSVIMSGNDEFLQQLRLRINEPLRQRITCYCRLAALSRKESAEYVNHHFQIAGAHQKIINDQAQALVHDLTSGIPRMINSLVLKALENAADNESQVIDLKHVKTARAMVQLPTQEAMP